VPTLYVASFGPTCWILSTTTETVPFTIPGFYRPVARFCVMIDTKKLPLRPAVLWYANLAGSRERRWTAGVRVIDDTKTPDLFCLSIGP
jgi:hypothetical protein